MPRGSHSYFLLQLQGREEGKDPLNVALCPLSDRAPRAHKCSGASRSFTVSLAQDSGFAPEASGN